MTGIAEGYESIRYRIEQLISGRERTVATASIATVVGVLLVLIVIWWMGSEMAAAAEHLRFAGGRRGLAISRSMTSTV